MDAMKEKRCIAKFGVKTTDTTLSLITPNRYFQSSHTQTLEYLNPMYLKPVSSTQHTGNASNSQHGGTRYITNPMDSNRSTKLSVIM